MSEVYCDWCFFKIPLSPFAKGGTGKDLEWFQHNSCDKKGCRSACFPSFKKRGPGGILDWYIPSNRNIFMTTAIDVGAEAFPVPGQTTFFTALN